MVIFSWRDILKLKRQYPGSVVPLAMFTALLWVNILIKDLAAFYSKDIFVDYFTLTMYDNVLQESPGQERFGDEFPVITAVTGAVRGEGARGVLPQLVALLPPI